MDDLNGCADLDGLPGSLSGVEGAVMDKEWGDGACIMGEEGTDRPYSGPILVSGSTSDSDPDLPFFGPRTNALPNELRSCSVYNNRHFINNNNNK